MDSFECNSWKTSIKRVLSNWYYCHKTKAVAISFLASFVVLSAFDVSTDFYQAYQHWDHNDLWWGISTLVLIFLPWIFTMLLSRWRKKSDFAKMFNTEVYYAQSPILKIWKALNSLPVIIQQFPVVTLVVNLFRSLVLIKLNGKIEKARDDVEDFGKNFIKENGEKANNKILDNESKHNYRKTLKGHSSKLSKLMEKQSAIIEDAALSKKAEVYLEASPQAILQMYIIAINGIVSISQIISIVVSLTVATFGTMRTYLKEPTKRFPTTTYDWRDMILTFIPTMALIFPRQMYLVLILSYLKQYAFIVIGMEVVLLMIVSSFYFKKDKSQAMIGAIASIFGPCFRVDELTNFYLATGMTSGFYSFLSMLLLPMFHHWLHVYENTLFGGCVPEPLLLEKNCSEILVTGLENIFEEHYIFGPWYFLVICIMWSLSFMSTVFLHFYMRVMFRHRISKALHLQLFRSSFFTPIWPTSELIWYPILNGILANETYFYNENKRAEWFHGKSVLGYCLKAGYMDMATFFLTEYNAKITQEDVQAAVDGGHLPMIQLLINHCKRSSKSSLEEGEVKTTEKQLQEWLRKGKLEDKGFKAETSRFQEVKQFLIQEYSHEEKNDSSSTREISKTTNDIFEDDQTIFEIFALQSLCRNKDQLAFMNVNLDLPKSYCLLFNSESDLSLKGKGTLDKMPKECFDAKFVFAATALSKSELFLAVEHDDYERAKYLLSKGTNPNIKTAANWTPLHLASDKGNSEMVKLLLDNGADADEKEALAGQTALHYASATGKFKVVQTLVKHGANLLATNHIGEIPYDRAVAWNQNEVALYFKEQIIAMMNKAKIFSDEEKMTLLHFSAKIGNVAMLKTFLNEKQVPVNSTNVRGRNVLHYAASTDLQIVQYLVDKNIPVDVQDNEGRTPLMYASKNGKLDIVQFLVVEKEASLELTNNLGWTALHFAVIAGNLEVTKFLVEHGAKVKATTYDGCTPYDKAVSWEKNEVIKYLREKTMIN